MSTYRVFSHVIDEPDHLAAGMQWLDAGKYTYEDQHPPLARVFGALGPYLAGDHWHRELDAYREGYRVLGFNAHYDRTLSLARFGMLPFFFLASAVVFLWAQRAAGHAAGVTAILLFTTLAPVLGHAGLVTTDIAATGCTGAAALASLYWLDDPSRRRSLVLGGLIGLAVLAKFSCLVFLPAVWLSFWIIHRGCVPWRAAVTVAGLALLTIWAGYRFSVARGVPAPHFFSGLNTLWHHNQSGHLSYLFGKISTTGFWYYFPVVLSLKTPLALLILGGIAAFYARSREALYPLGMRRPSSWLRHLDGSTSAYGTSCLSTSDYALPRVSSQSNGNVDGLQCRSLPGKSDRVYGCIPITWPIPTSSPGRALNNIWWIPISIGDRI